MPSRHPLPLHWRHIACAMAAAVSAATMIITFVFVFMLLLVVPTTGGRRRMAGHFTPEVFMGGNLDGEILRTHGRYS